jgi:hypothetical protein
MVRMLGPGGMQKKQKFHNASAAAIANILTFSRGLLALNEAKALSFRRVSVESLSRRPGGPFVDIDPRALAILHEWLKGTGAEMTEARLRMTRIPNGAEFILNKVSGAPGFWIGNVIVMAGVPSIR